MKIINSKFAALLTLTMLTYGVMFAPLYVYADEHIETYETEILEDANSEVSPAAGVEEINEAYDFVVDTEEDGVGASAGISSGGWSSLGSELSYMEFPEEAVSDNGEEGVWTYCVDISTDTKDGHKYSMTTLDAAGYYDEESADKIRRVLTESYPSMGTSELEEKYDLEDLTDEEAYMATQWVIWYYSNPDGVVDAGGGEYYPANIYKPSEYPYETVPMWYEDDEGTEKCIRSANVVKFAKLLDELDPADAYETEPAEIIFNKMEYDDRVVFDYGQSKGLKTLKDVVITVKNKADKDVPFIKDGTFITILHKDLVSSGESIKLKVVFKAIQTLCQDAYFFSPEGGRDASQSRVAVYSGTTPVEATEEFTISVDEPEGFGGSEDPSDSETLENHEDSEALEVPDESEDSEALEVFNDFEAPSNPKGSAEYDENPKTGDEGRAVPFALMVMAAALFVAFNKLGFREEQ